MILAHYGHRLPAKYDFEPIRVLTSERARVWDARPKLYFKAFLLREAGRFGAIASHFSSLYLWHASEGGRSMSRRLGGGRLQL